MAFTPRSRPGRGSGRRPPRPSPHPAVPPQTLEIGEPGAPRSKKFKLGLEHLGRNSKNVVDCFDQMDTDHSRTLSKEEFHTAVTTNVVVIQALEDHMSHWRGVVRRER